MTLKDLRKWKRSNKIDPIPTWSKSKGHLLVCVCWSEGPAGGPSSYRRCALGGNEAPPKEVRPSTTALVDKCGVLRGCLRGGTYVSQSPRRANRGALKNGGQDTHTRWPVPTYHFRYQNLPSFPIPGSLNFCLLTKLKTFFWIKHEIPRISDYRSIHSSADDNGGYS